MKNIGIAILLLLAVTSCLPSKVDKKDPEPELAGTYQMTSFIYNGATVIPKQGVTGSVNVVKDSDTQISISLSTTTNGQTSSGDLGSVSISKSSGSGYDIVESGVRFGSIDGTTFTLAYSDNTGSFSISARK
ncbi:hypothetical protein [Spirosoma radiotolerans]|uniref:Lipocalin-like domain-containing protein n=1 Tax=Spirosoma radiotolerans TaxID=1379870 RepID=A0A0E3V6J9_9BACT|nr:hypothetical protein [Spirosoma radiotolerans]AKD55087.1 hypothetical protein SD10_09375 [Spirosoma radiotolerans]